ncbi:uncharacterized protein CIMG_11203 [Coccidioides immitis RS]|uniref:Uncharacterized protein n=1 Tax=Coccidioides immitis (strain RS) TaxID=246410 RepID=A0A0D8JXA3_COCIM|nr:uncharacterized protein CIMG_11203 [Coccidioides immitis RS]KJF61566.1 hypothetical protein CIMG_11203 [Coccidioides immitis RS]
MEYGGITTRILATSYQWSWFRARRDRLAHHMERSTSRFCKLLVDPPNILTRPAPKFQKMTFSIKVDINIFNRVLRTEYCLPSAVFNVIQQRAYITPCEGWRDPADDDDDDDDS